ncbi:MAG TPA: response regulator [Gaiellaceae bacterium]|nr:response regulator [Gaiellaceae bacterium]
MNVARAHRPDAIVLDFRMPCGDGALVLERMRAIASLATVPVVVLSACDRSVAESRVLAAGARRFLEKPVSPQELVAALREALPSPGPASPPLLAEATARPLWGLA